MAALPTVNTDQIAAKHQPQLTGFTSRQTTLETRIAKLGRITPQIAQEAAELDTDAKRWIDAFDAETKPIKDALFKAHRAFTGFCEKMSGSAAAARTFSRKVIGQYQLDEQRKADAARREQERLAREAAEAERKAQADELLAQAAATTWPAEAEDLVQAAIEVEQAPIVPIAVPEVAPTRIEGTSVSYKLVGTVTEPAHLLGFLTKMDKLVAALEFYAMNNKDDGAQARAALLATTEVRMDLINEFIDWRQSGINAALKRGLNLPGVSVERQPVVRNLSGR